MTTPSVGVRGDGATVEKKKSPGPRCSSLESCPHSQYLEYVQDKIKHLTERQSRKPWPEESIECGSRRTRR